MATVAAPLDYVFEAMDRRDLGLAPHYLTIYAIARGMGAREVLEFGAGVSTRVLLDALAVTDGHLVSISTDPRWSVVQRMGRGDPGAGRWEHHQGQSTEILAGQMVCRPTLDLVVHDGSHTAGVVASDLRDALPRLRRFGLALVHDSQHSDCGEAVRSGIRAALHGLDFSAVTLPYGFGLTILRREDGLDPLPGTAADKVTSPHRTEPTRFDDAAVLAGDR